jgi:hypothetical protein
MEALTPYEEQQVREIVAQELREALDGGESERAAELDEIMSKLGGETIYGERRWRRERWGAGFRTAVR